MLLPRLIWVAQYCKILGEQPFFRPWWGIENGNVDDFPSGKVWPRISLMNSFIASRFCHYLVEHCLFIVALYFNQPHNEPIIELNELFRPSSHGLMPSIALLHTPLPLPAQQINITHPLTGNRIISRICFLWTPLSCHNPAF